MELLTKTKLILFVVLIAGLFGFLPSYGQDSSAYFFSKQPDTAVVYVTFGDSISYSYLLDINPVTESELLYALELADHYLKGYDEKMLSVIYVDEPTRLRMQADQIEQKEADLAFIKSIRVRLALYGVIHEGKKHK